MKHPVRKFAASAIASAALLISSFASAHGDVVPQGVDTTGLPVLGTQWRAENPYRSSALALKIGTSAYNQNCARCRRGRC